MHIGQPRERLAGAPAYDPSLVNERDYGETTPPPVTAPAVRPGGRRLR